jgi:hypothetical protein
VPQCRGTARGAFRHRRAPVLKVLHTGYRGSGSLRKRTRRPGLTRSEAVHLDRLLDEALRETFPASDPVAITVEKASKGVEPNSLHSLDEPEAPPDKPDSPEAEVASILPIVGLFSANFLVLRQISYFFDWWCRLLGGRR